MIRNRFAALDYYFVYGAKMKKNRNGAREGRPSDFSTTPPREFFPKSYPPPGRRRRGDSWMDIRHPRDQSITRGPILKAGLTFAPRPTSIIYSTAINYYHEKVITSVKREILTIHNPLNGVFRKVMERKWVWENHFLLPDITSTWDTSAFTCLRSDDIFFSRFPRSIVPSSFQQ